MRPDYDFGEEFEYGLDLILDGLARSLPDNGGAPPARQPRKPVKGLPRHGRERPAGDHGRVSGAAVGGSRSASAGWDQTR